MKAPARKSIHKTSKIRCKSLKLGRNVTIEKNVRLTGNEITIGDGVHIKNDAEISSETITIGRNTRILGGAKVFAIEKFEIGANSVLCKCSIRGRRIRIGSHFYSSIHDGTMLEIGEGGAFNPKSFLRIGDRCAVHNGIINLAMPVEIGNGVVISNGTALYTHYFWQSAFEGYPQKIEGIRIADGCSVGVRCTLLPGTSLGKNTVVGAGAVVTKKFPANCIVGGNPARVIRRNVRRRVTAAERSKMLREFMGRYAEILSTKGFDVRKERHGFYIKKIRQGGIPAAGK